MLLLLVPPLGLIAALTVPDVRVWKKLAGGFALVFLAAVLAAIEQDEAWFSRFALDLAATVHYQKGISRYAAGHAERKRIEELHRAFLLEPAPSEPNVLNQRPNCSEAGYRLGRAYQQA